MVKELVKLLNSETCLALVEARLNVLVKVLNMEFFCAELPLAINDPVKALRMEFFSEMLEVIIIEPVGLTIHVVATPACNVQETGFVVDA